MPYCAPCEAHLPLAANYCMYCGTPLRDSVREPVPAGYRWEFRRIEVPLGVRQPCPTDEPRDTSYRDEYARLVAERLRRESREGWEPLGPTDCDTALMDGQITLLPEIHGWCCGVWQSVGIRLRRLVPATWRAEQVARAAFAS
jgi:hypothetical protein